MAAVNIQHQCRFVSVYELSEFVFELIVIIVIGVGGCAVLGIYYCCTAEFVQHICQRCGAGTV
ncbi:hypothetical protein D3C80_2141520 [compost metagenome]